MRDNKTINFAGLHGANTEPHGGSNDSLALLRLEIDELRRENQALRTELERVVATQAAPVDYSPVAGLRDSLRQSAPVRSDSVGFGSVLPAESSAEPRPFTSATPDAADRSSRANFVPPTGPSAAAAVMSSDGIDFGAIAKLTPDKLDGLPYGLITLDAVGRVIHYNDTESRLVGLPKDRVIGRNFFTDVAPCTRLREFEGRFMELAADPVRVRVQTFDFVFRFAKGEQHVTVVITPARTRGQFHMALIRRMRD